MRRIALLLLFVAMVFSGGPFALFAQDNKDAAAKKEPEKPKLGESWPKTDSISNYVDGFRDADDGKGFLRPGGGFYFSYIKLALLYIVFLWWVKQTDWLSQDCLVYKQNYAIWNPVFVGSFLVCFVLLWIIPIFWIGWFLLILSVLVPPFVYSHFRNQGLGDPEKILTPMHYRYVFSHLGQYVGLKIRAEKQNAQDMGVAVKFVPKGADDQTNQANLITARQSPGWVPAKDMIADMVAKRAEQAMLDFTNSGVSLRYSIDGHWHAQPAKARPEMDPVLAVFKKLGNGKEQDRRSKQEGNYEAEYDKVKYKVRVQSQGVETGERAIITLSNPKKVLKSLVELGMRPKLQEKVKAMLQTPSGFVLASAPQSGGFSTVFSVTLRECDRYMRDFVGLEEKNRREPEVENVHITEFDISKGETPLTYLRELELKYPNAYALSDLFNAETVAAMIGQTKEERLVIGGIRAKGTVEALLRVLMMKVPPKDFAPVIHMIINMRTIRKLCEKCKESYKPSGDILRKLGLTPAQVPELFRPPVPTPDKKKPPCEACNDMFYMGRTGIFEVMFVGDNVRQAMLTDPKPDVLMAAARRDGMVTLQEEGILTVASGVTSLDELMRVLKG